MVSKRAIRRDTLSGDFGRAVRPAHSSIFFGVVNNLKSNAACAPRIRNGGITGSRMLLTPASVERGCCSNETRVALAIPGSQTNSTECHSPKRSFMLFQHTALRVPVARHQASAARGYKGRQRLLGTH